VTTGEFASAGSGSVKFYIREPEGEARGIVQFVHGIAEHSGRYERIAGYLAGHGYATASEDHMGHGASVSEQCPLGCVRGGWDAMARDVNELTRRLRESRPELPLFLLGHSMGSFLARTCLYTWPDSGIKGAVLSGTAWQPGAVLAAGRLMCRLEILRHGADRPSEFLTKMMFGAYTKQFDDAVTQDDWINSIREEVELYTNDPLCGFTPSGGLILSMRDGMSRNQKKGNLAKMPRGLPVLFIAGDRDPVGGNGKGVTRCFEEVRKAGMRDAEIKLYPGARHEVLNEKCSREVRGDLLAWLDAHL
jgi:alpha-beta hydrolase superfamily lysophospholipase